MDKDVKFDRFIETFDKKLNTDTSSFKTITTSTSTRAASDSPSSPSQPSLEVDTAATVLKSPQSPSQPSLLSTPTRARRNSISPDDAPLSATAGITINNDSNTRDVEPSPKVMELRPTATQSQVLPQAPQQLDPSTGIKSVRLSGPSTSSNTGLKRSNTMGGISSVHRQPSMRRGLNLGLNLKRSGTPTGNANGNATGTPQSSSRTSQALRSPELVTPTQDRAKRLSGPSTDSKVPYGNHVQQQNYQYSTPVSSRLAPMNNNNNTSTPVGDSGIVPSSTQTSTTTNPSTTTTAATPNITANAVANARRDRTNTINSVISTEFNEVDDSLRILAAKEMKVIELKDKLKLLQHEIETEEMELKKLRDKIGNSIYKGISPQHNNVKKTVDASNSSNNNNQNNNKNNNSTPKNDRSKRESIWSKPVNFLNQFDQLLQTEIERINKEGFKHSNDSSNGEASTSANESSGGYSIWSFVNDVKHGLLGEAESPTRDKSKQLNEVDIKEEQDEQEMITIRK